MSTKKGFRNPMAPLIMVAAKQRVGQADADAIALPVLVWFDAAKRGRCSNVGCNHLTTHLIIATYIASRTKSKAFHDACIKAYQALHKASGRPGDVALTTTEYAALRVAFGWYLRGLPNCEVGVLNLACKEAERIMGA